MFFLFVFLVFTNFTMIRAQLDSKYIVFCCFYVISGVIVHRTMPTGFSCLTQILNVCIPILLFYWWYARVWPPSHLMVSDDVVEDEVRLPRSNFMYGFEWNIDPASPHHSGQRPPLESLLLLGISTADYWNIFKKVNYRSTLTFEFIVIVSMTLKDNTAFYLCKNFRNRIISFKDYPFHLNLHSSS